MLDWLRSIDPMTRGQRRKMREGEPTAAIFPVPFLAHLPVTVTHIEARNAALDTESLLRRLPDTKAKVVRMRLDGYTMREIGEAVGARENTASKIHGEAIIQMRAAL